MKKLLSFLVLMCVSLSAMASETSVKNAEGVEIWYDFDSSAKSAAVTYKGGGNTSYYDEYSGDIVIPSTVTYEGVEYSVTSIGGYAFAYCRSLTSITLPEGVTSIGIYAFDHCYSLTSITLPESLTSIGEYAFYCCSGLTSITLPESLTSIGKSAFYSCSALTSINLPEGVTSIGDAAFNGCPALTSITLPEGLTSIGDAAFNGCYKLYEVYNKSDLTITAGSSDNGNVARYAKNVYTDSEVESKLKTVGDYIFYVDGEDIELIAYTGSETSITLPSDYEGKNYNIGDYAFYGCDALTSITLPESLTSIGDFAFYNCNYLTSITIPEGVTSIGEWTFAYCSALTSITSKNATPPTIGGSYPFYDVDKSIPVYVPKSSVDAYKSAEYWKDFTNFIGGAYFVDVTAENGTVEGAGAYEENAEVTLTVTPAEGYKFVKWSDGVTDNPRTVVVTSDTTFTADIQKGLTIYATAENGDISGVGVYLEGDEATVTATPNEGYKFVKWSDGVTDNPRTVVVVSDTTFTAEFEIKEYTLTIDAENGTVEGAGTYKHGDEVTLTATPAEGYKFVKWSDGGTDNPRTVVVVSDMTFTAEFEIDDTPISDIQTSDVNVRLIGNEIAVEGADDYTVYSVSGQNLGKVESVERGIYIVVVNGKSYKVVAK